MHPVRTIHGSPTFCFKLKLSFQALSICELHVVWCFHKGGIWFEKLGQSHRRSICRKGVEMLSRLLFCHLQVHVKQIINKLFRFHSLYHSQTLPCLCRPLMKPFTPTNKAAPLIDGMSSYLFIPGFKRMTPFFGQLLLPHHG